MPTPEQYNETKRQLKALGLSMADALEVLDLSLTVTSKAPSPIGGSYDSLREKIRAEKAWRQARYTAFARLYEIAHCVAMKAGDTHRPEPMVVQDQMTGHVYEPVMDGVCGFAWVTVRPANSSFALWAKKERGWSKAYGGGMQLWVHAFGQSMERKEQYARTFARVLTAGGVEASAGSRLD